jgi:hypothetical protein
MFTLTFAEDEVDGKFAKSCLDGLHRWFSRNYPESEVAWKLEFQRRGTPHFHLLVRPTPGSPISPDVFPRVVRAWKRLGGGRIAYESKGSDSRRGVISYMANYLAKKSGDKAYQEIVPDGAWSGRFWGIWGHPELLPEAVDRVTFDQFLYVVDYINVFLGKRGVEFRFRNYKTSSRYDPALAYAIRAALLGESATDSELAVMSAAELAEWNELVDSGLVRELCEGFPEGSVELVSEPRPIG